MTPEIVTATEADGVDRYLLEQITESNAAWSAPRIPRRFAEATATHPAVVAWVRELVHLAVSERGAGDPAIRTGPSLLLKGLVGTGKTWQAYGAMRALSAAGVHCRWQVVHELDLFAALRPRSGVDSEGEFARLARADVLVVDDLGTEKRSDWVEATLLRLIDLRNREVLPTIFTTNVPPGEFSERFGERVTSRLVQMCQEVYLDGPDRRRERS